MRSVQQIQGDRAAFERYEGWDQLLADLMQRQEFSCVTVVQITKGLNNGLFILQAEDGARVVAKFYLRDDRSRLAREYTATTFLLEQGFAVATPILRNDEWNYAVYSYEEGRCLDAREVTQREVEQLADFLVALHQFRPSELTVTFPRAVAAMVTVQEVVADSESIIAHVESAMHDGTLHSRVRQLIDPRETVEAIRHLNQRVLAASLDTSWEIVPEDQRLSPVDFGLHNALFRGDAPPVIVDLEYFGWDDPLHPVAEFVVHARTAELAPALKEQFLQRYTEKMHLSERERLRLRELVDLIEINWIANYLNSLTPAYIRARRFAAGGTFDEERYIREQIEKLVRCTAALQARIP